MVLNSRYENDGKPEKKINSSQKEAIDEFKKNMPHPVTLKEDCPLCHQNFFTQISKKDRYGIELSVVACKNCGLVFANPYYTIEFLQLFYSYYSHRIYRGYASNTDDDERLFLKQIERGKNIYNYLNNNIGLTRGERILEVGAGAGGILGYFQYKGHEVLGVDINDLYLEYGRQKGIELLKGDSQILLERGIKTNVLLYCDVLEHIPDINAELYRAKKLLHDGGYLYVTLPSIKKLPEKNTNFLLQIQNAHVYYFSLHTLTSILEKHGFKILEGNEQINAVFKKNKTKSTKKTLISDYNSCLQHLREAEKRRRKLTFQIKSFVSKALSNIIAYTGFDKLLKFIFGRRFYSQNKRRG